MSKRSITVEGTAFLVLFVGLWRLMVYHAGHKTVLGGLVAAVLLLVVAAWFGWIGFRALRRFAPRMNGKGS